MRALFIGGSGTISAACSRRAVEEGVELTVLNRGTGGRAALPDGVETVVADVRDPATVRAALGEREFDAVVDFVAFTAEHVAADLELFAGRTGQYVFISSASAYQKPLTRLPITESTPLRNPYWQYSRDKIAAEDLLVREYREHGFPMTIVRPSHTYDETRIPLLGGWTAVDRLRRGKEIVVQGDGTSLWTLTHSSDFAVGLVGLLGAPTAIGEAFHITSDDVLTWDAIAHLVAGAAGAEARIVHVPSDAVAAVDPAMGASLLGDKAHSVIFDNSKIRAVVPGFDPRARFAGAVHDTIAWYDAQPERHAVDPGVDATFDRLVEAYRPLTV